MTNRTKELAETLLICASIVAIVWVLATYRPPPPTPASAPCAPTATSEARIAHMIEQVRWALAIAKRNAP